MPFSGNCQKQKWGNNFKFTLKPHDFYVKDNMPYYTFDINQTKYLLLQKKIKDLYDERLLLTDTIMSQKDSIIKNYKSIIVIKQQQLDSTSKTLQNFNNIINVQKVIISDKKKIIKQKNKIIITLVGIIGATLFFTL